MHRIKGLIQTDIYATDDGHVALKQGDRDDCICRFSVDQLPEVIGVLQSLYADRQTWAEPARE